MQNTLRISMQMVLVCVLASASFGFGGNPLFWGADPSGITAHDGRLFVFPTNDKKNWSEITDWHCWSTTDLVNWKDHGVIFNAEATGGWGVDNAWAPGIRLLFGRAIEICEELVEKEGRRELRSGFWSCLFNRAVARGEKEEWEGARGDIEECVGLLAELIGEGQRHIISLFYKAAGYRCAFAGELGGAKEAAEWANDAMRWFVEEAEAGGMNEVLSKAGRGEERLKCKV